MQLDVDVSPPANIMTFRPGLIHLTFDLDTGVVVYNVPWVHPDGQTESDAYEPTVQGAQVGSKN